MARLVLLKNAADFAGFRSSRTYQIPDIRIRVLPSPNQNSPRFGFIVPKKILPKVTDRNIVKRRIKAILGKHAVRIKSVDVLFFPTSKVLKYKFSDLEEAVIQLFKRANIWKS